MSSLFICFDTDSFWEAVLTVLAITHIAMSEFYSHVVPIVIISEDCVPNIVVIYYTWL